MEENSFWLIYRANLEPRKSQSATLKTKTITLIFINAWYVFDFQNYSTVYAFNVFLADSVVEKSNFWCKAEKKWRFSTSESVIVGRIISQRVMVCQRVFYLGVAVKGFIMFFCTLIAIFKGGSWEEKVPIKSPAETHSVEMSIDYSDGTGNGWMDGW